MHWCHNAVAAHGWQSSMHGQQVITAAGFTTAHRLQSNRSLFAITGSTATRRHQPRHRNHQPTQPVTRHHWCCLHGSARPGHACWGELVLQRRRCQYWLQHTCYGQPAADTLPRAHLGYATFPTHRNAAPLPCSVLPSQGDAGIASPSGPPRASWTAPYMACATSACPVAVR